MAFEKEVFIEACKAALSEEPAVLRDLVAEAVSDPAGITAELGEPTGWGVEALHNESDLTVINFVWAPFMTLIPHNHRMGAVIGIYAGREDNIFWRHLDGDGAPGLEAAGAESLGPGQVATLGKDIIHSVANPIGKLTSAIHVYAGNFFEPPEPRSQWDHETLTEAPWDMEDTRAAFREADHRYRAGLAAAPAA